MLDFFIDGKVELYHQSGWLPDQTERVAKYFNELMELDVTFSVSQFFSPSLFGSGSKNTAREIPKCFKNRPQDNDWILNSEWGRRCVDEKGTNRFCGARVAPNMFNGVYSGLTSSLDNILFIYALVSFRS